MMAFTNLTKEVGKSDQNLIVYDRIAKSYSDAGQTGTARSILIKKLDTERGQSESFWE
jgi:hypothetical protein